MTEYRIMYKSDRPMAVWINAALVFLAVAVSYATKEGAEAVLNKEFPFYTGWRDRLSIEPYSVK